MTCLHTKLQSVCCKHNKQQDLFPALTALLAAAMMYSILCGPPRHTAVALQLQLCCSQAVHMCGCYRASTVWPMSRRGIAALRNL